MGPNIRPRWASELRSSSQPSGRCWKNKPDASRGRGVGTDAWRATEEEHTARKDGSAPVERFRLDKPEWVPHNAITPALCTASYAYVISPGQGFCFQREERQCACSSRLRW